MRQRLTQWHARDLQGARTDDLGFDERTAGFGQPGAGPIAPRSVVVVEVERNSDSRGHRVPLTDFVADRDRRERRVEPRAAKQGGTRTANHVGAKNTAGIDGLPGIDAERQQAG